MLCTTCNAWSPDGTDLFCANCGACLVPVEVELDAKIDGSAYRSAPSSLSDAPVPSEISYCFTRRAVYGDLGAKLDFRWISLDQNYIDFGHLDPLKPLDEEDEGRLISLEIDWPEAEKGGAIVRLRQPADGARERPIRVEASPYANFRVAPRRRNLTVDRRSGQCHITLDAVGNTVGCIETCVLKLGTMEIVGQPERAERFIFDGWPLRVSFQLPSSEITRLKGEHGALSGEIEVAAKGLNAHTQSFDVNLFITAEASAKFFTSAALRARAGGNARVAFSIRNAGGRRVTLHQITGSWHKDGSNLKPMHRFGAHEDKLEPSQELQAELRIPARAPNGADFEPGKYKLTLNLEYFDGSQKHNLRQTTRVEIKPDTVLKNPICIDFGTTETAACIMSGQGGGEQYPMRLSIARPPLIGENGIVAQGRYFIPTAVALVEGQTSQLRCGDDAIALMLDRSAEAANAEDYSVTLIENLKRDIGKFESIGDGEDRVSYDDLVAAYLKHVIALIEDHPDVTARVETVIVTKPAVFREQRAQKIKDAFEAAGVTVEDVPTEDGRRTLMSESWSPVMGLIDILEEDCFVDMKGIKSLSPFSEDQLEAGHYLLTYDVGGGTTDLSLLKVSEIDGDLAISEEAAETTELFAGRAFEQFITAILVDEMQERGYAQILAEFMDADFKGDPKSRFRSLDRRARVNRRAMNKLVRAIQADDGLFGSSLGIIERIYPKMREQRGGVGRPRAQGSGAAMREIAVEAFEEVDDPFVLSAEFEGTDGMAVPFVVRGEALAKLKGRIVAEFEMEQAAQMESLVVNLLKRAGLEERDLSNVKVVASGRGSLFPPGLFMIYDHMNAILGLESVDVIAKAEEGKAITSWGGLLIWHLMREAGIRFSVRSHSVLALFVKKGFTKKSKVIVHPLENGSHWWSGERFRLDDDAFSKVRNNDSDYRIGLHYPDTGEWEDLIKIPKIALEGNDLEAIEIVKTNEGGWTWESIEGSRAEEDESRGA
jgi:hypothetical protein